MNGQNTILLYLKSYDYSSGILRVCAIFCQKKNEKIEFMIKKSRNFGQQ